MNSLSPGALIAKHTSASAINLCQRPENLLRIRIGLIADGRWLMAIAAEKKKNRTDFYIRQRRCSSRREVPMASGKGKVGFISSCPTNRPTDRTIVSSDRSIDSRYNQWIGKEGKILDGVGF